MANFNSDEFSSDPPGDNATEEVTWFWDIAIRSDVDIAWESFWDPPISLNGITEVGSRPRGGGWFNKKDWTFGHDETVLVSALVLTRTIGKSEISFVGRFLSFGEWESKEFRRPI